MRILSRLVPRSVVSQITGLVALSMLLGIGFYGRGWTGVTQAAPGGSATGPAPGTGVNCSGWDTGKYSSYAGPIYWSSACVSKVIVDSPSGNRVFDGWIFRCE